MANSVSNPRDNVVRTIRFSMSQLNYPLSSGGSFDFNQGDLLFWDTAAGYVKPVAADVDAANLAGVALRSSYLAPYASAQVSGGPAMVKNYFDSALVGFGAVFSFYSTSAETYSDNDVVYFGGVSNNSQIITKASGAPTRAVGVVKLPPGRTTGIAGGATVLVPVLVIPQWPVQTL